MRAAPCIHSHQAAVPIRERLDRSAGQRGHKRGTLGKDPRVLLPDKINPTDGYPQHTPKVDWVPPHSRFSSPRYNENRTMTTLRQQRSGSSAAMLQAASRPPCPCDGMPRRSSLVRLSLHTADELPPGPALRRWIYMRQVPWVALRHIIPHRYQIHRCCVTVEYNALELLQVGETS